MESRKRYILSGLRSVWRIVADEGAVKACGAAEACSR
jgi:hypothetical protein